MPYTDRVVEGNEGVRALIETEKFWLRKMRPESMEAALGADKAQVVCSSFSDPGDDWNRFEFFKEDELVATHTVDGY